MTLESRVDHDVQPLWVVWGGGGGLLLNQSTHTHPLLGICSSCVCEDIHAQLLLRPEETCA